MKTAEEYFRTKTIGRITRDKSLVLEQAVLAQEEEEDEDYLPTPPHEDADDVDGAEDPQQLAEDMEMMCQQFQAVDAIALGPHVDGHSGNKKGKEINDDFEYEFELLHEREDEEAQRRARAANQHQQEEGEGSVTAINKD